MREMKNKMTKIYMAVTKDKYELPYAIADSPSMLAKITGEKSQTIRTYISTGQKGFVRVEVEDDDESLISE